MACYDNAMIGINFSREVEINGTVYPYAVCVSCRMADARRIKITMTAANNHDAIANDDWMFKVEFLKGSMSSKVTSFRTYTFETLPQKYHFALKTLIDHYIRNKPIQQPYDDARSQGGL